jgi:hypothetical protein
MLRAGSMISLRPLGMPRLLLLVLVAGSMAVPRPPNSWASPAHGHAPGSKTEKRRSAPGAVTKFRDGTAGLVPPFFSNTSLFDGQFTGVCVGDYDNDGDEDIYFTNNGNPATLPAFMAGKVPPANVPTNLDNPEGKGRPNGLYRNDGVVNGIVQFHNVAKEAGVEDLPGIGAGCVFADFDNDGDLDLLVVNKLRGITFSEYGFHSVEQNLNIKGFRDGSKISPLFDFDSDHGQLNGEYVVVTDPVTGKPRGEGRNTLYRNMLMETGQAKFVDVTDQAGDVGGTTKGLPGGHYGTTAAVADVNGDSYLDIYVGNFIDQDFWNTKGIVDAHGQRYDGGNLHNNAEMNRLYLNNGDMTFTDVTEEAGVGGPPGFFYDYDGSRHAAYDPELKDIQGHPVGEPSGMLSWGVSFFDFNQDGRPDILVSNDVPGTLNLYRNDTEPGGRPRFTDVTRESGMELIGEWMGCSFGDLDHDGDLDVFCANFGGNIYAFTHNTDPAKRTLADDVGEWNRWQQNASVHGLFRNDGTRIVRKNGVDQQVGVFPNIIQSVQLEQSRWMPMWNSDPTHVSPQKRPLLGLAPLEFAWGSAIFDYDNDTWPDLYTVGSLGVYMENPGRLIRNLGDWHFRDVSVEAHALDISLVNYERVDRGEPPAPGDRIEWKLDSEQNEKGGAVATADLDGNGFPDLIVTNGGSYTSSLPDVPTYPNGMKAFRPGPTFIFLNDGNSNHWLKVKLSGGMRQGMAAQPGLANRDGIGARVVATLSTPGGPVKLVQEVAAGNAFQASSSKILLFGLGSADEVEHLEVFWPWGGKDELFHVKADQLVTVEQKSAGGMVGGKASHR